MLHNDGVHTDTDVEYGEPPSLATTMNVIAAGTGVLLLLAGLTRPRRSFAATCLAGASAPFIYRGIVGAWPWPVSMADDTRTALGGPRGTHVRESIRLEMPVADVYAFWRRLENLPLFMRHLERVSENPDGTSHWVARAPGGLTVEWDAEIINEVENQVIGWGSLPGSDVVSAGSVTFEPVRGGRSTQVNVVLQYAPPAGRVGAVAASWLGRAPSQTIREDLRRLKQLLEAGEVARASADE